VGQATTLAREEFIEDDLKRLTMEDPDAMSMIAEMFGMNPEAVVEMLKARVEAGFELTAEQKKIFTVRRKSERGGLPVPAQAGGAPLRF
jgi:3-dehydroquinate dehydratase